MDERLISAEFIIHEDPTENRLRPQRLKEYIGQAKLRENLQVFIQAAQKRREPIDHVLLYGPPGLGKTTLAHIIANEMGGKIKSTSGPVIEKAGDLAAILTNLEEGDILFIDEIHRLPMVVEEILYPAMEDFQIDIVIGQGPAARTLKLDIPPFTLVGATTRLGRLSPPLRDRFGIISRLEFYKPEELLQIVKRSAGILRIDTEPKGAEEIARRSRGTPRIANRLLRRVRDFAEVQGNGGITLEIARTALKKLEVDHSGFDHMDRQILLTIIEKFNGGPVGLDTLAAAVGEEKEAVEDVIEPYLLQQGFLHRTPRGRIATPLAYQHFQKTPPEVSSSGSLFGEK